jgi:hypothetical protein
MEFLVPPNCPEEMSDEFYPWRCPFGSIPDTVPNAIVQESSLRDSHGGRKTSASKCTECAFFTQVNYQGSEATWDHKLHRLRRQRRTPGLERFWRWQESFFLAQRRKARSPGGSRRICSERPFQSRCILQGRFSSRRKEQGITSSSARILSWLLCDLGA